MSHSIEYASYPENVNKERVQKEWDRVAAAEGRREGATGLYRKIRWLPDVLGSRDEAEKFLNSRIGGKDYDQVAVRYRKLVKEPAYVIAARTAFNEATKRYGELNMPVHYASVKAKFVACKNCGSSLAREYLRSNRCPLCGVDMRPASKLDAIEKAGKNVEKARAKMAEAEEKAAKENKNKELLWLVRVEYHT